MRVCVFGAGAIGSYLAGHLARAGHCEVSVVARGKTLEAIRANGLHVAAAAGEFSTKVRAVADTKELGPQDYVFLTLKAHQLDAALGEIAPLIGPHTSVIPPTTGLPYYFFHGAAGRYRDEQLPEIDPGGRQWAALPPAQVLGCVYWIGAHTTGPGSVAQDGAHAGAPVGELDGSRSDRVAALGDLLTQSGIRAPVRDNIRGEIWIKFVNSLCWNPVAVLTLARMGEMGQAAGIPALVTAMMREADTIADAIGVGVPQPPEKRITTTLSAPQHKMSMLQDLEHGRPLELDPLVSSLASVARLTGLPTPTLDTVLALARLRAAVAANAGQTELPS